MPVTMDGEDDEEDGNARSLAARASRSISRARSKIDGLRKGVAAGAKKADFQDATFSGAPCGLTPKPSEAGTPLQKKMGLAKTVRKEKVAHERRISRKSRNRWLAISFGLLVLDATISVIFVLLAPTDPRLTNVVASRRQLRTVYIQGIVALADAVVSALVVVHVVQGILSASLDNFLEAAVTLLHASHMPRAARAASPQAARAHPRAAPIRPPSLSAGRPLSLSAGRPLSLPGCPLSAAALSLRCCPLSPRQPSLSAAALSPLLPSLSAAALSPLLPSLSLAALSPLSAGSCV
jgi:hypothetical protein